MFVLWLLRFGRLRFVVVGRVCVWVRVVVGVARLCVWVRSGAAAAVSPSRRRTQRGVAVLGRKRRR